MPETSPDATPRLGWKTLLAVAAFYLGCVSIATFPLVKTIATELPSSIDPLQHLRTMRWYKTCLLQGRSPYFSPETQYPMGVPLGYYSPMQIQAAFYFPLSFLIRNDILIYNLLWFASLVMTGLGTFVLAWTVVKERVPAAVAGLLTMIGTPVLMHAHAHLELINVGFVPLFLAAWIAYCDRPSRKTLFASTTCYLLATMSAAYFGVLVVVPACLYLAWRFVGEGRGAFAWIRPRIVPLIGFGAIAGAGLFVLFSSQIWAEAHGFPMARPRSQFESYGTTLWSYLLPTHLHALGKIMPVDVYELTHLSGEGYSYLGIVALLLIHRAWVCRAKFPGGRYWWAAFGLMIVLSLGAKWHLGTHGGTLPAEWLHRWFRPFRVIRVPARFNIFASVCAAVIAAAGLKHWLAAMKRPWSRAALVVALLAIALFDLSVVPFTLEKPPAMPACYAELRARDPGAAFHDVPHLGTGGAHLLPAACDYWRSLHGGKTTAGYSSNSNGPGDSLSTWTSPFYVAYLMNPAYVANPADVSIDLTCNVDFQDYTWLYLTEHDLRYVVLHHWPGALPGFTTHLEPVKDCLKPFKVLEDAATTVYDRDLMPRPTHVVALGTRGWLQKTIWQGREVRPAARKATLIAYNPAPDRDLTLSIALAAFHRSRVVRLLDGERELARWEVGPERLVLMTSPPFRLPEGRSELTLASDGDDRPFSPVQEVTEGDRTPYSLRVQGLILRPTTPSENPKAAIADQPRSRR